MRNAAFLSVVLLVACAGSSAPPTQYLLRAEPAERSGRVEAPVRVGLGRVAVAPYLDQSGIVVETEAGQVQAAREHQWAEPLDAGLRSYLRAGMSAALGYDVSASRADLVHWDYTVDVYVDRLHGTMAGTAVLDASYRITPRPAPGTSPPTAFPGRRPCPGRATPAWSMPRPTWCASWPRRSRPPSARSARSARVPKTVS